MPFDEGQRQELAARARTLLDDLQAVAYVAQAQLASGYRGPITPIAGGTNPMVDGRGAEQRITFAVSSVRSALERIAREPFIARLVLRWEDVAGKTRRHTLYVTRSSAAGLADVIGNACFAGYGSPLGRLAEFEAGEERTLLLDGQQRPAVIEERIRLRPETSSGVWDGLDDAFEFESWTGAIDSLRQFLDEIGRGGGVAADLPDVIGNLLREASERNLVRQKSRRHAISRIALRDQPILDQYQGEVFRLPLDRRLLLLGPAGTGKTTTLVHRVAQKRTPDALSDDENRVLERAGLLNTVEDASNWVMFTPTELLKLYLRDAFSREGVATSPENLRTWSHDRLRLGRSVLRILRSGDSRGYQFDDRAVHLADSSSPGVSLLYDAFSEWFEGSVSTALADAYGRLTGEESSDDLRRLLLNLGLRVSSTTFSLENAARLLDGAPGLQEHLRRLTESIDTEAHRLGNALLNSNRELLGELIAASAHVLGDDADGEDDDDSDDSNDTRAPMRELRPEVAVQFLLDAIRRRAAAFVAGRSTVSGRAGRVLAIIGDRLATDAQLRELGALTVLRSDLRTVLRAPRTFVMTVPSAYAKFRRDTLRSSQMFLPSATEAARQNRLGGDELDVLILLMLRNARRLLAANGWRLPSVQEWLVSIENEYRLQVMVDEATDFSAAQLACMTELSKPRVRSWFACGDFNQRITGEGIQTESELTWIGAVTDSGVPEVRRIQTGYRQSSRLRQLAGALCDDLAVAPVGVDDVEHTQIAPVLLERCTGDGLGVWVTERVSEIESALGVLPSIAIFVDGDERIDAVVESARSLLARRNISIVGCKEGRVVGDADQVRVFDVKHIKGLEFEAVLFVGIDHLADRLPELFKKYFYVGVSRAATYLGVTCEGLLPAALDPVRTFFTTESWT